MNTADKLITIAENQQKVYDKGYSVGHETGWTSGYDEGLMYGVESGTEQGKQAQYEEFWNEILYEGRNDFSYAFAGWGWSDKNFNPPQKIKVKGTAYMMFGKNKITDLRKYNIDFSEATDFQYLLWLNTYTKYVGHIDVSGSKKLNGIFHNAHVLEHVESITGTDGVQFIDSDFYCDKLKHIIFTNCTINNSINLARCPLSKDSISSVINALSSTAEGKTVTLKKSAVNTAFGMDIDNTSTYTDEWTNLVNSKYNWKIVFA